MTGLKIKECASAILISTDGRFLFQLRDNVPGISDQGSSAFLVVAGRVTRAFWTALSVKFTKRLDILYPPNGLSLSGATSDQTIRRQTAPFMVSFF
jgi:hypothetical protein